MLHFKRKPPTMRDRSDYRSQAFAITGSGVRHARVSVFAMLRFRRSPWSGFGVRHGPKSAPTSARVVYRCYMCCFSGPVEDVAATRIFARMASPGRQILAYEMMFAAANPVAMILPLPTPPHSAETDVRFISLEQCPALFEELYAAFTWPKGRPRSRDSAQLQTLAVQVVGAFVASFVPTLADFARLDPRFRIPPGTVDQVPGYGDYGFVVFQLGAAKLRSRVHPMAFEFSTRDPERLFFPLLHVHDGQLHAQAAFDHVLYAQGLRTHRLFEHRSQPLRQNIYNKNASLVLDLYAPVSRREMTGTLPNRDEWAQLV
jgi:hypothetical protein